MDMHPGNASTNPRDRCVVPKKFVGAGGHHKLCCDYCELLNVKNTVHYSTQTVAVCSNWIEIYT